MTLTTASPVPATETGIVCARCSTRGRNGVQVRHASVAAVRLCQTGPTLVTAGRVERGELVVKVTALPPVPGARPVPSPADMLAEAAASADRTLANVTDVPSETVSPQTTARWSYPDVPAGRYAIRGTDGVVKFYVVDKPTEGKWAGCTFVDQQAGDDLHPVKDRARRTDILAAIGVDPLSASRLYGTELGRCGVCNRTLTDPDSIAAGIGPVCASRF